MGREGFEPSTVALNEHHPTGGDCDTRAVRSWHTYEQAMADLSGLPPEERLAALVTEWTTEAETLAVADVRKLFVDVWPDGRGSIDDHSRELLTMLLWIAPVRDVETYLVGSPTIFRAANDDRGIRWTLDEAAATAEARAGGTTLFRATVAAADVLGHFTGTGDNEVLVDPQRLTAVEVVSPT
jgi:hypothetical protein